MFVNKERLLKLLLILEFAVLVGLIIILLVRDFKLPKAHKDIKIWYFFYIKNNLKNPQNKKYFVKEDKIQKKKEEKEKYTYDQLKLFVKNILYYHGVKPVYKVDVYDKICNFNTNVCNKVKFYKTPFDKKVEYLAIIQFVIKSIDDNLKYSIKINDVIKSITIDFSQTRRGYAWHRIILINAWSIKSNKEFLNVLTHELGHILDLGVLNWKSLKKDKSYTEFWEAVFSIDDPSIDFYEISWLTEKIRRGWQTYKQFVSWYWMTDPFEDFAESFNTYMNHYLYFKYLALNDYTLEQKFNFFESLFWGFHFFDDVNSLKKVKISPTRRPRDSTLMK